MSLLHRTQHSCGVVDSLKPQSDQDTGQIRHRTGQSSKIYSNCTDQFILHLLLAHCYRNLPDSYIIYLLIHRISIHCSLILYYICLIYLIQCSGLYTEILKSEI